ncbi:MAG: carbamoyltransferase N-terminal domain-containing protein, partial [Bryobacteraceae bacterium]
MNILGLNAFHGDSSAAILSGGQLVFALEEERLNRMKHWAGLPVGSAEACLAAVEPNSTRHVAISRDPNAHFWRKAIRALASPSFWGRAGGRAQNNIRVARYGGELRAAGLALPEDTQFHHVEHHRSHMASAFFASPFEEAAVVSVDGFGDFSSVMWGVGKGNKMDVRGAVHFPHSLGIYYTAFTQFLGFPKYGDEYKMMGLAAYGEPRFAKQVRDVLRTEGGQVRLNLDYFTHHDRGVDMTWDGGEPVIKPIYSKKMLDGFGQPRLARSEIQQVHMDMAASVQMVLEENYFALLNHVAAQTGQKRLCLAGGVALNCAANGSLFERTPFRELFIQP